ncbi:MAG: HD domain-containing protein [Saprospiraceae bacterium]
MNQKKIFNDPVYGFTEIPYGLIFDLVEHPYFQRLRRIKQLGFTHYVYPGALHTRFHHALGALHLMTETISVLRSKGTEITEEESQGVLIAILLHDMGHGPFSHALEHTLVSIHHEDLSVFFMEALNRQFNSRLTLAIQIFKDEYPKKFLHQLVSGQLDMDRMDYLNRDSFFTGVSEGVIGYDRIIKMLAVRDNQLLVEEKGIYSIERFLTARRIMYWQVYLHKTVLAAEQMLIRTLKRAKELALQGKKLDVSKNLAYFLYNDLKADQIVEEKTEILEHFAQLDDYDIVMALKSFATNDDFVLSFLAKSLLNRKLFKIQLKNEPFSSDQIENVRQKILKAHPNVDADYLLLVGEESNNVYSTLTDEISILFKDGQMLPMSLISELGIRPKIITKYYLCYPKNNL